MSSAELTVWARVNDLDRRAIQHALWKDRTLVKTWAMRGTLHLLPAAELPVWHAALGTSRRYLRPALWQKYFGITIEELDRLTEAIGTALQGRTLTREELATEVRTVTGSAAFAEKLGAEQLGHGPEARGLLRPPVLRAEPRSASPLHQPRHLAVVGGVADRSAGGSSRCHAPFPVRGTPRGGAGGRAPGRVSRLRIEPHLEQLTREGKASWTRADGFGSWLRVGQATGPRQSAAAGSGARRCRRSAGDGLAVPRSPRLTTW